MCLLLTRLHAAHRTACWQGQALTPEQVAAQESLVPPPLRRLGRRLGLKGSPEVAVAPRLASLVRRAAWTAHVAA